MLGIALTALASRLSRRVTNWRAHPVVAFCVGAIAAAIPVGLCCTWAFNPDDGDTNPSTTGLLMINFAIVVLLAACSAELAWYRVWRTPGAIDESLVAPESAKAQLK